MIFVQYFLWLSTDFLRVIPAGPRGKRQPAGENLGQECTARNTVYETWCNTCLEIDKKEIESRKEKREPRIFKYIGETARSPYERGLEHQMDVDSLSPGSHILKHCLEKHEGNIEDVEFRMKVLKYTKTSFERQILESVLIQENREKHNILNSRAEYNRCSLPRLSTKLGEKDFKKWEEERDEDLKREEILENKIREMKKARNRTRGNKNTKGQPARKKRRKNNDGGEGEYENIDYSLENMGEIIEERKKRKIQSIEEDNPTPSKKRNPQTNIKDFFYNVSIVNIGLPNQVGLGIPDEDGEDVRPEDGLVLGNPTDVLPNQDGGDMWLEDGLGLGNPVRDLTNLDGLGITGHDDKEVRLEDELGLGSADHDGEDVGHGVEGGTGHGKKANKGRGGTCSSGLLTVTGQYGEVVRHEDGLGLGNPGDDTGNDDADEGLGSNKTDDKIGEDGLRLGRGDDGQVGEGV